MTAPWIAADEASRLLGVSRTTLYAYVSRGYVRSQATAGPSRERLYSRDDVERLRRRTEARRDPDKAAARSLQWGLPVLESSIAFIDGRRLYYRGHDAVELSRSRSVAEVASLIWSGRFEGSFSPAPPRAHRAPSRRTGTLPFVARAQAVLAAVSAQDHAAFDLRAGSVAHTGWRILHLLTRTARLSRTSSPTVDQALAQAWGVKASGVDVLRSALILCADHELNVSSFTARCVASAGSHPTPSSSPGSRRWKAPGMAASARASSRCSIRCSGRGIRERRSRRDCDAANRSTASGIRCTVRRPAGDCAARHVARAISEVPRARVRNSRSPTRRRPATREQPNLDFALAPLARVLRLPAGSPLTIFAIGRTIGWIGHAIEQYATGQLIRPRAKYVGVVPVAAVCRPASTCDTVIGKLEVGSWRLGVGSCFIHDVARRADRLMTRDEPAPIPPRGNNQQGSTRQR